MSLLTATAPPSSIALRGHVSLRRLAWSALVLLALTYGFGDIARISLMNAVLLDSLQALVLVAIALTLASAVLSKTVISLPRGLVVSGTAWLVVLALSALFAPSRRGEALGALSRPVGGVLLAWTVCQLSSRGRWERLAQALAAGGLLIAMLALSEAAGVPPVQDWLDSLQEGAVPIGDVPRVAATLSHPNEAAMLLELCLPLLLGWAWSSTSRLRPMLYLGTVCTLAALVLTFSRAGVVAALVSLGAMALVSGRRRRNRAVSVGVLVLVVPLTLGWAAMADPGLDRRLLAGLDESSALQPSRSEFWTVALQMVRDQPVLGVGPDNFRWRFTDYSGIAQDNLGIHAHNQYLEALADTGVLGLATFLSFVSVVSAIAARRAGDSPWRAALLASLIAWLLHALLDDFERFWPASVAFWIVVGLIASDYPVRWVSPLMRSAVPRARVSSSPVTLPKPSSTEPLT